MNVITGAIVWLVLVLGSAWIQLDGIHHLFDISGFWAVIIFALSATFFPPASLVWFIVGVASYF